MHRLLIAINSQSLTDALTHKLSSRFEVHSCCTGTDAAKLLENLHPAALIIDLRLSESGGLAALESCSYKPTAIIALTDFLDDGLIHRADAAGVTVLVRIPCTAKCITGLLENAFEKAPSPET